MNYAVSSHVSRNHEDEEGGPLAALFVALQKVFSILWITSGFLHLIRFFPQQNRER
jgi:hypothetical protein